MKIDRNQFFFIALMSAACCNLLGCASMQISKDATWKPTTWFKKDFQSPTSVATIWKADTMPQPGQTTQRGFGARVYFYNDRSQAIPVDGDLVVHGYITTPGMNPQKNSFDQADKKFTFSGEQLASQYSPSDLGASYSIWIPWDAEGGYREEVTLIATFKSKAGEAVQSSPTRLFLPGNSRLPNELPKVNAVQQVSYERASAPTYDIQPSQSKPPTRITTIELPQESNLACEPETVSVGGANRNASQLLPMPRKLSP